MMSKLKTAVCFPKDISQLSVMDDIIDVRLGFYFRFKKVSRQIKT